MTTKLCASGSCQTHLRTRNIYTFPHPRCRGEYESVPANCRDAYMVLKRRFVAHACVSLTRARIMDPVRSYCENRLMWSVDVSIVVNVLCTEVNRCRFAHIVTQGSCISRMPTHGKRKDFHKDRCPISGSDKYLARQSLNLVLLQRVACSFKI